MNRGPKPKKEGAVRRRKVPQTLIGKTQDEIKKWAREQLDGEEADLSKDVLGKIQKGELHEISLRPKKKGFFLPDGTFVEAFDYSPRFGEDLDEAELKWDEEEKDRKWIDEENSFFNKSSLEKSERPVLLMWEHGKRTLEYAQKEKRPLYRLQVRLAERAGLGGYGLQSHQICTELYLWKKSAHSDDSIFSLTWGHIDCIIRFSREGSVRDLALETMLILMQKFGLLSRQLYLIFGTKEQDEAQLFALNEMQSLLNFRANLKEGKTIDTELINEIVSIARKSSDLPLNSD